MNKLVKVLQAELEIVREMVSLCRQEQAALLADDLASIQETAAAKAELARRLAALEEERRQATASLPAANPSGGSSSIQAGHHSPDNPASTPAGPASSNDAVPEAGSSEVIEELRAALRRAAGELRDLNDTNRLLARQSLAYVQKMLSLLMPPPGEAPAMMDRMV